MTNLWISIIALNLLSFLLYGIDKLIAISNRKPTSRPRWHSHSSATRHRRISESTLLWVAILGGSVGAMLGMHLWHHKTLHKKFRYGIPTILLLHIILAIYIWHSFASGI